MWLQHPIDKSVAHNLSERTEKGMIQAFLMEGYIEVKPCYMRSPAGDVFFVDHPAHQHRLHADGYVVVDGPEAAEPAETRPAPPPAVAARAKK